MFEARGRDMPSDEELIVLIVDDEESVLKLMARQLAELPYKVVPTTSAAEALHLIETQEVALLLCDLNMPQTDGSVILAKARVLNPDIVSVVISGGADTAITIKAVNEGGIWKYIEKPWKREGSQYYLVMEYVRGQTLWDIGTQHGALALDSVLQILYVCSDALSYAHRHGVLHKDLKPDNILLADDGVLKIIDFGIACLVDAQRSVDAIMGTPAYMSPEQLRGDALDARSDIYSMGIIVCELLTGMPPFPGTITLDNIWDHLPFDTSRLPVAEAMRNVIAQATDPERDERFDSMFEFGAALIDAAQNTND